MKHELTGVAKGKIGIGCTCGRRFPVEAAAIKHVNEENAKLVKNESEDPKLKAEVNAAFNGGDTPPEYRKDEETIQQTAQRGADEVNAKAAAKVAKPAPPKEPAPEKPQPPAVSERTQEQALSPLQQTANMVRAYANNLVDNKRAQQFFAQVSLMTRNNPKLANVQQSSLLAAVMACVHLDLMPNTPEGYAYIIPYGDQAQFQLGYKGLAELAYRTGTIRSLNAELVFPEDDFDVELGTSRRLVHKPSFDIDRTDYKAMTHVYATIELTNGATIFEVLTHKEVGKVQASAKAKSTDSPWQTWPEAMAKKTAVKRLLKLVPSSTEDNRLKVAAEWDSLNEGGKRLKVEAETGEIIEGDKNDLPEEVEQAINAAESREDLNKVLQALPVNDRKKAASLANIRMRELA